MKAVPSKGGLQLLEPLLIIKEIHHKNVLEQLVAEQLVQDLAPVANARAYNGADLVRTLHKEACGVVYTVLLAVDDPYITECNKLPDSLNILAIAVNDNIQPAEIHQ